MIDEQEERSLRENEARFRAIVQTFDGLIYICSRDLQVEFLNQRAIDRTGFDGVGHPCYKVIHGRESTCPWCMNDRVFAGETVRWEVQSPRDNRWYYVADTPLYHTDGTVSKQVMMIDVTDRKQAENELREAKDYAESLVQTANAMVIGLDTAGRVTVFNDAVERITGYTREELSGVSWFEVLVPKDRYPEVWKTFNVLIKGGFVKHFANPILTKSGDERYIVWQNSHVMRAGEVVGTISFGIDITDRRRAEEALRESEERFRQFFQTIPEYAYLVSLEGRILEVNDSACKALGYPRDEMLGQPLAMIYARESLAKMKRLLARWKKTGTLRNQEMVIVSKSGQKRVVLLNVGAVRDKNGRILHSTSIQTDMTELREAEAALKRNRDKLAEAKRLSDIGVLAASVAHDLRGPLSVITAAIYNIKRKSRDKALAGRIARIERKVADSNQIITNLLRYVRTKDPVLARAGIYRVVLESASVAAAAHADQKIKVRKNLVGIRDVEIDMDVVQIKEVLDNVLSNAYDALADMEDKGVRRIDVTGGLVGKTWVEICISDNGPGIAAADIDRLFDPLFSTKARGIGLGLTVCRELIKRHRGSIDIESREGQGTTVRLRLPLPGSKK